MRSTHMQIGEVADQTGLSLRTIRYYEEVGLVAPTARTPGGFRLYAEDDVARLHLIKRMKPLDFSLEETRELLTVLDGLEDTTSGPQREDLVARLEMFHDAARARVAAVRDQLAIADGLAHDLATEVEKQRRPDRTRL